MAVARRIAGVVNRRQKYYRFGPSEVSSGLELDKLNGAQLQRLESIFIRETAEYDNVLFPRKLDKMIKL